MNDITTVSPIEVIAEVKEYTLVGDDIYIKQYTADTIPAWYKALIDTLIHTNPDIGSINNAISLINALGNGYSAAITALQNSDTVINSKIDALVTKDTEAQAAITSMQLTKIDSTTATAIAENVVSAHFAGAGAAWFDSKIAIYASEIDAHALSINNLTSTFNNSTIANTAAISQVYTDMNTAIANQAVVTSAEIATTEARIISSYTVYVDANLSYDVNIYSSNGSMFKNGVISTTLSAQIIKGKVDVTADIAPALFSWQRISNSPAADTIWNTAHSGIGNSVIITSSDVYGKATFRCIVNI